LFHGLFRFGLVCGGFWELDFCSPVFGDGLILG